MKRTALVIGMLPLLLLVAAVHSSQAPADAITSACQVGPTVSNLDRSAHFYHDLLGFDLVPDSPPGPLHWDADPGRLDLHGLPMARLRFIDARMPGVPCGIELVEFADAQQLPVHRRLSDPGAAMLILLVRDIDAIFSRLKAEGVTVLTKDGRPMAVGPSKARAVIVADPDGHFVELAQLEPPPSTPAPASANIIGIRLRITVADLDKATLYYRRVFGMDPKPGDFTKDESVMAMMGLPATAEYRVATSSFRNSSLLLELIEFKGVPGATPVGSRVQDPGSYRIELNVRDINETVAALKTSGSRIISSGGVPVRLTLGSDPWRLAVAQAPDNLFLVVQQRLAN